MPTTVTTDFETRSRLDLTKVGAHVYATHPSTDVLCVGYAVDDGEVKLWKRGEPVPAEIITAVVDPSWGFAAFNAAFERVIWANVLCRYGWPALPPLERWCCLQARALAHALPASLEDAAAALKLAHQKADSAAMRKLARPRKDGSWNEDPSLLEQLYSYCKADIEAERALAQRLAPLSPDEQRVWRLDQEINDRGFYQWACRD